MVNQIVDYILSIPRLYPEIHDENDNVMTYFNYGNTTTTYYSSLTMFKQSLIKSGSGRHETFITKSILKGHFFDVNNNNKHIFYDCNFTTNTFCMWIGLNQVDIKSWLRPRNKLFNGKWLKPSKIIDNDDNNGRESYVMRSRLYRLVIFNQSTYYVYQHDNSKEYCVEYYHYENRCDCKHRHEHQLRQVDEQDDDGKEQDIDHGNVCLVYCQHEQHCNCYKGNKVIFVYFKQMFQYQKLSRQMVRLYYHTVYNGWTDVDHFDSHVFHNGTKILHKSITIDNQLGEGEFSECSIDRDKEYGINRVWTNLSCTSFWRWLQYLYVPMNAYHNNIYYIGFRYLGQEHGISYDYIPVGQKSLHTHGNVNYRVKYDRNHNITSVIQNDESRQYHWCFDYRNDIVDMTTLFYCNNEVLSAYITMYLGVYFLCRDNYMICHDYNTNRFLSYFDKIPPEIGELILSKLTGHKNIKINKTFTLIGINLLYPQVSPC